MDHNFLFFFSFKDFFRVHLDFSIFFIMVSRSV